MTVILYSKFLVYDLLESVQLWRVSLFYFKYV